jgi:diguanylate cyclase (GGDEF)-like protein
MAKSDSGLDTAAAILRVLGEQAFDTEDMKANATRAKAEAWARHLLMGTAHPDRGAEPASERERDYAGARRWVELLRRSELGYVRKSLGEFRSIIMSLVQNFHRAVAVEGDEDRRVAVQIDRLRTAIESNSIEKLKLEASSVAASLSHMVAAREQRRSVQFEELGTELKTMHKRLEVARKSSETCALTGLHNRRALDGYLDRVVEFDGLTGVPALIMILDVDNFKLINDNYGHPVGDEALKALAREMIKLFLRKCDFVARYGGEEFVVVVRDMEYKLAGQLAERVRERLSTVKLPSHPEHAISVSIGVAELRNGDDPATWLMRADAALLKAKQQGKNRVVLAA